MLLKVLSTFIRSHTTGSGRARYLCDGVIDVDGGHLQFALLHHLVQVVDPSRGLLRQSTDA